MSSPLSSLGLAVTTGVAALAVPSETRWSPQYAAKLCLGFLSLYFLLKKEKLPAKANVELDPTAVESWKKVDVEAILKEKTPCTGKQYLVVGAGFLGKRIIHMLLLRGETRVRAMDLDPRACECFGDKVEFIQGNVTNVTDLEHACKGIDTVFCTFAVIRFMDGLANEVSLSYDINVKGTALLLEAAKTAGVKEFIQTSTSNVCLPKTGTNGKVLDETSPYVTRETSPNHYGWTKALAEQSVIAANSASMRTVSVRPCSGIFGARDNLSMQLRLETNKAEYLSRGFAAYIDWVYVENVAYGHLLAEAGLHKDHPESVAGEIFCISNLEPLRTFDLDILLGKINPAGLVLSTTPTLVMYLIAYIIGIRNRLYEPRSRTKLGPIDMLTPVTMSFINISYVFSSAKAQKVLGYKPLYTVQEAIYKSVEEHNHDGALLPALSTQ